MIKYQEIVEGNLKAEKCTDDFGGPNQWNLYVMNTNYRWESVQWMGVHRIQAFFKTRLPIYGEAEKPRYELKY